MKKYFKIVLLATSLLLIFSVFLYTKTFSCHQLSCIEFASRSKFSIEEIYEEDNNVFRAFYSDKNRNLRVEVISNIGNDGAKQYINSRIARMNSIFTPASAPYPGEISNEIVCTKEFQPLFYKTNANGLEVSYFIANLNQRKLYGSCSADQVIYKGVEAFLYCPKNRQVVQLEIFEPRNEFDISKTLEEIKSIRCK